MSSTTPPLRTHWQLLGIATLLAYGGMLWQHGQRLWTLDYFQFFPVYLIAVGWMTAKAVRKLDARDENVWHIEVISMVLSVVSYGAAIWYGSPWLGALSLLLLGNAILAPMQSARRSWRLLALLIPLPLGLDRQVVQKLQQISSFRASQLLDFCGVPHVMRGNVLELGAHRFFVEEACSGIGSIYLMVAATALYVVFNRIRFIRAVPLLASVLWWAIVANTLRIVIIAASAYMLQLDLSHGWKHELLGIVMMLIAFAGICSTRYLVDFIFAPIKEERMPRLLDDLEKGESPGLTPTILWDLGTMHDRSRLESRRLVSYFATVSRSGMLAGTILLLLAFAATYWGIAGRNLYAAMSNASPAAVSPTAPTTSAEQFGSLGEDCFRNIRGIDSLSYSRTADDVPDVSHSSRPTSKRWLLESPGGTMTMSVSGPFHDPHDVIRSRIDQHWKLEQLSVHSLPSHAPKRNLLTLQMTDKNGERSHIHSCQIRPSGELVQVPAGYSTGMTQQFRDRVTAEIAENNDAVVWQLELEVHKSGASLAAEFQSEHILFADMVSTVRATWKNASRTRVVEHVARSSPKEDSDSQQLREKR